MKDENFAVPAKVRYKGDNSNKFTNNKVYDAYFIEYWQGIRNSLHVKDDTGRITDFNPLEDFEIISDPADVLNFHEAIVECISTTNDDEIVGITIGKQYKSIGRDKDGLFLVMDNSFDCYFYPPDCFKIISDEFGILQKQSIYYSFNIWNIRYVVFIDIPNTLLQ